MPDTVTWIKIMCDADFRSKSQKTHWYFLTLELAIKDYKEKSRLGRKAAKQNTTIKP